MKLDLAAITYLQNQSTLPRINITWFILQSFFHSLFEHQINEIHPRGEGGDWGAKGIKFLSYWVLTTLILECIIIITNWCFCRAWLVYRVVFKATFDLEVFGCQCAPLLQSLSFTAVDFCCDWLTCFFNM